LADPLTLPNADTAKAIYVLRMSSGLMTVYNIVELIDSADMSRILMSLNKLCAVDDIQKAGE
jgi:hypothetical protein